MGRPKGHSGYKKPEEQKRTRNFTIWFTPSEAEAIESGAANMGLDASKYIRLRLFGEPNRLFGEQGQKK
jgi:hypothetical protein